MIFVGRSPDALFHFLSGALFETAWADRMKPLSVALRRQWIAAEAERAIRPYLDELGLSPAKLLRRIRPAAFVDVVDTGGTFGDLVSIMHAWTEEASAEWRAVARKIRLVGLTWREKTSPKTWRWQQHADWAHLLPRGAIKNVSRRGAS